MTDSSSTTIAQIELSRTRALSRLRSRVSDSSNERPGWTENWWSPLVVFSAVGVLVWIAIWFGYNHLTHDAFFPMREGVGDRWFGGFARWDAEWYRTIVREGYVYYPGV